MDEIFRQLGELFLGSVPTMILFLLLLFCYTTLIDRPLRRTLAVRRERTAGAVEKAQAAIALAEAKTGEYEAKLRAARNEIARAREQQVAGWNAAREAALGEARDRAAAQLRETRAALEAEAQGARAAMSGSIDALATQIIETVLPGAMRSQARGAEVSS